ncbi:MAG: DUF1697 domain-containing protein [Christensenellales bacterium]
MKEQKIYCAFLRGVNVGRRRMKMPEVCRVFQQAGMTGVSSVLASGNILFRSDRPRASLRDALQRAMSAHYASEVYMFIKNHQEIEALLSSVPFAPHPDFHIYAFLCEPGFEKVLMEEFHKISPLPGEEAALCGLRLSKKSFWGLLGGRSPLILIRGQGRHVRPQPTPLRVFRPLQKPFIGFCSRKIPGRSVKKHRFLTASGRSLRRPVFLAGQKGRHAGCGIFQNTGPWKHEGQVHQPQHGAPS